MAFCFVLEVLVDFVIYHLVVSFSSCCVVDWDKFVLLYSDCSHVVLQEDMRGVRGTVHQPMTLKRELNFYIGSRL